MFYVPDGTLKAGVYECVECGSRFLDLSTDVEKFDTLLSLAITGGDYEWI